MLTGYIRVSSNDEPQSVSLQCEALIADGAIEVLKEHYQHQMSDIFGIATSI